MSRRLFSTTATAAALLLGSSLPAHSMTAQGAHNKPDDIAFEAFARAAAYHCGGKSFGEAFTRDSKRYVKALYPTDSEKQIAKVSVGRDVAALSSSDCPRLVSQMKDLQVARAEELKALGDVSNKFGKSTK